MRLLNTSTIGLEKEVIHPPLKSPELTPNLQYSRYAYNQRLSIQGPVLQEAGL
jgi:hypothetical protein